MALAGAILFLQLILQLFLQLGFASRVCADFSSANFQKVWAEEFGHVNALGGNTGAAVQQPTAAPVGPAPAVAFQSQQPHPAVARIVVPEHGATSFGSGTLVDVRDDFGLVITNWHVVRDAQGPIEVIFPGGFTSQARAVKSDADWDLAALVIWKPPVAPVAISGTAPRPGDQLTICGYGPGIYRAATGYCTQYYAPKKNMPQQMVELNVEARQGDSGGPIFNSRGELAGVLFGAGQGTTLGSFGGRVDEFLASLAPDIGRGKQNAIQVGNAESLAQQRLRSDTTQSAWQSTPSQEANNSEPKVVKPAAVALLEPPAIEELSNPESLLEDGAIALAVNEASSGQYLDIGESQLFNQLKSALAAVGLFSLVVLMLKAAG
jgi:S1-C subfamily serine protease